MREVVWSQAAPQHEQVAAGYRADRIELQAADVGEDVHDACGLRLRSGAGQPLASNRHAAGSGRGDGANGFHGLHYSTGVRICPHWAREDDGRWTMDDGRWTMDDGRWTMADGRWTMEDG